MEISEIVFHLNSDNPYFTVSIDPESGVETITFKYNMELINEVVKGFLSEVFDDIRSGQIGARDHFDKYVDIYSKLSKLHDSIKDLPAGPQTEYNNGYILFVMNKISTLLFNTRQAFVGQYEQYISSDEDSGPDSCG
jgi:hypothetical protein